MSDASGGIGTRIAEVRRFANLSQVQLAEQLGISKPGLANYERGVRVPPASLVMPGLPAPARFAGLIDAIGAA